MRKIVFVVYLILTACNSAETEHGGEQQSVRVDTVAVSMTPPADSSNGQHGEESTKGDLYEYRNDTLLQSLEVNYISDKKIRFKVVSFNKARNRRSSLTGIAQGNVDQDPEIDEDEEGVAYPAIEYRYVKDNCYLSIRIEFDVKDKARIIESNCDRLHESGCPFASLGVLKKVNR